MYLKNECCLHPRTGNKAERQRNGCLKHRLITKKYLEFQKGSVLCLKISRSIKLATSSVILADFQIRLFPVRFDTVHWSIILMIFHFLLCLNLCWFPCFRCSPWSGLVWSGLVRFWFGPLSFVRSIFHFLALLALERLKFEFFLFSFEDLVERTSDRWVSRMKESEKKSINFGLSSVVWLVLSNFWFWSFQRKFFCFVF